MFSIYYLEFIVRNTSRYLFIALYDYYGQLDFSLRLLFIEFGIYRCCYLKVDKL